MGTEEQPTVDTQQLATAMAKAQNGTSVTVPSPMDTVNSFLNFLERRAHVLVSAAAIIVSAINTSALSPTDAAAVVLISNALGVVSKNSNS